MARRGPNDQAAKGDGPDPEAVLAEAVRLGFDLSPEEGRGLSLYLGLLVKWNRTMNLVGPSDWATIFRELVADSLHLAGFLNESELPEEPLCLDLGAGAGLPGIPLRILWGKGRYVLVEPRAKRTAFLENVLARLPLPGVDVFVGRAEEAREAFGPADLVLARAFKPWPEYLDLARGLVGKDGAALVLSSEPPPDPGRTVDRAPGWRLARRAEYRSPRGGRYFGLFVPDSISM